MSVQLKRQHFLLYEGSKWAIPEAQVVEKLGKEFLLMVPTCYSLCKMVQGGGLGNKHYSLKNIAAYEDLLNQRNIKSNLVAQDDLFDGDQKNQSKRRKTTPVDDEELSLDLPGGSGSIICLKAKKTSEALHLEMTEPNLGMFFDFFKGMDTTSTNPRSYQSSGKFVGMAAKRKAKSNVQAEQDAGID